MTLEILISRVVAAICRKHLDCWEAVERSKERSGKPEQLRTLLP